MNLIESKTNEYMKNNTCFFIYHVKAAQWLLLSLASELWLVSNLWSVGVVSFVSYSTRLSAVSVRKHNALKQPVDLAVNIPNIQNSSLCAGTIYPLQAQHILTHGLCSISTVMEHLVQSWNFTKLCFLALEISSREKQEPNACANMLIWVLVTSRRGKEVTLPWWIESVDRKSEVNVNETSTL